MTSPKSKRSRPAQNIDNYTLHHIVSNDVGLYPIDSGMMNKIEDTASTQNEWSSAIDIGFTFKLNEVSYSKFALTTAGWLVLLDPTTSTWSSSNVDEVMFSGSLPAAPANLRRIRTNGFLDKNHAVLVPWGGNYAPVRDFIRTTNNRTNRQLYGFESPDQNSNLRNSGCRYWSGYDKKHGKVLVVRFNLCYPLETYDYMRNFVVRYDCVLYENGKIEYRYISRDQLNIPSDVTSSIFSNITSSIGVFLSGTDGSRKFRDFSANIGYFTTRSVDVLGGYKYSRLFSDQTDQIDSSSVPYSSKLVPTTHWPASNFAGGMFVFTPEVNRRKVLPKIENNKIQSRKTFTLPHPSNNQKFSGFDDRRTFNFVSGAIVDPSTRMQRFYSNYERSSIERNDTFGNLLVTSSISDKNIYNSLYDNIDVITPFDDSNSIVHSSSQFYTSSLKFDGFSNALKSKTCITIEIPINYKTEMPGASSSIYYLNKKNGCWQVPFNSSYQLATSSDNAVSGKSFGIANPGYSLLKFSSSVDVRGWNAIGIYEASGSMLYNYDALQNVYNVVELKNRFQTIYSKSLLLSSEYNAINDEIIKFDSPYPFVVEKIDVEFPLEAGPGWFNDTTKFSKTETYELTTNLIEGPDGWLGFGGDLSGPALTFALMHQQKNINSTGVRNIIASGTITHKFDNKSEFTDVTNGFVGILGNLIGFRSFGVEPSCVIMPDTGNFGDYYIFGDCFYTGSVKFQMLPAVSVGAMVYFSGAFLAAGPSYIVPFISTSQIAIETQNQLYGSFGTPMFSFGHITPYGRSSNNLQISGRSILSNEFFGDFYEKGGKTVYVTNWFSKTISDTALLYPNDTSPNSVFEYSSVYLETEFAQWKSAGTQNNDYFLMHAFSQHRHKESPYLLIPGDDLIVSVSKTRPHPTYLDQIPNDAEAIIFPHEVRLSTGSVKLKLYGSYIKEGKEFHDVSHQQLVTNDISTITIGGQPVLDQFELFDRSMYAGTYTDDFITGSLLTATKSIEGKNVFYQGTRQKAFSKYDVHNAYFNNVPGNIQDIANNLKSKQTISDFVTKNFQKADNQLNCSLASNETYYDSIVPELESYLEIGHSRSPIFLYNSGFPIPTATYILLDYADDVFESNSNVSKAFPFESKFDSVKRNINKKSVTVDKKTDFGSPVTITQIEPYQTNRIASFMRYSGDPNSTVIFYDRVQSIDEKIVTADYTIDTSIEELNKFIFGFGDINNVLSSGNTRYGTTQLPEFKYVDSSITAVGPIPRGWKYGLISGIKTQTKSYWRRGSFGQPRDMLEQRPFTVFYKEGKVKQGPVTIKFVTPRGQTTAPENTWSSNLSTTATSSLPYFDDNELRNRGDINLNTINQGIIVLNSDNGNISI